MPDTVGRKPKNEKARPGLIVAAVGLFLLVFRKKPLLIDPHS